MYTLLRPLLFLFNAEAIHNISVALLRLWCKLPGGRSVLRWMYDRNDAHFTKEILGLKFKNPVGLAAGFDKNAVAVDELACLGFGFIEIGTVTPKPQSGNAKPRLFRLPQDQAIINRMGFNNKGAEHAAKRLSERRSKIIIGGNIGKNKTTSNENAWEDYRQCFETLYQHVDYFVVNVSSPNTPGLRELQEKEPLTNLLNQILALARSKEKVKPVLLKIAPDLTKEQLNDIIQILKKTGTNGVIATNTTVSRNGLLTDKKKVEQIGPGGLSGKPLGVKSNEVITFLRQQLGPDYPIIGVGGIMTPQDAIEKLKAGADLIQIYTGFIYNGPGFVKKMNRSINSSTP